MSQQTSGAPALGARGFLGLVERLGNLLPDPVIIFVWLIAALMVLSAVGAALGWSASLPYPGEMAPAYGVLKDGVLTFRAQSLFSEENVGKLLTEAPRTVTGFAPLGMVLLVMFGAAVAERVGLFSALIRAGLRDAPRVLLTPLVAMIAIASHLASDAAYVVVIPLAGLVFAAAGRHPLAGIAAAFAAVAGGIVANFTPTQLDVLLFSFTQEAARIIDPAWNMNPLGNWWYSLTAAAIFVPTIWIVTDRLVEPRLGRWQGEVDEATRAELAASALTADEWQGLRRAGLVALLMIGSFAALALWPGYTPLIDESRAGPAQLQPFYAALVPAVMLLFLMTGIVFGVAVGRVRSASDIINAMADGVRTLAPYIVFILFAAHFVAMFNWSRLGPIAAINGAEVLKGMGLPAPLLLVSVQLFSSVLDLFIGSASAKWSAMAPVVVPMFMLLGISPEMTTAAYRMGDSYTNIMTPLMAYFPLLLAFCRRWEKSVGVGSVLAMMLPYALCFFAIGVAMTLGWMTFDLPLGPGAVVGYPRPGT